MTRRLATDAAPPRWPDPIAQRRIGPAVFRILPASHPSADLELLIGIVGSLAVAALVLLPLQPLS
ncbi:MAG: hypothetical protein OEQ13_08460, partial [Acidobacteriota bacterium]|nr:hypothetical protein [Acidobacteriota bacterium]